MVGLAIQFKGFAKSVMYLIAVVPVSLFDQFLVFAKKPGAACLAVSSVSLFPPGQSTGEPFLSRRF